MTKIEVGDKVKDVVSGFTGIVTAKTRFLTGCDRITIEALSKDSKAPESHACDITAVELIKKGVVKIQKGMFDDNASDESGRYRGLGAG